MKKNKLSQEAIEARKAYFKAWRERNKERKREYNRKYWERVAEKKRNSQSKG